MTELRCSIYNINIKTCGMTAENSHEMFRNTSAYEAKASYHNRYGIHNRTLPVANIYIQ